LLSGPGLPRRAEQWAMLAARNGMAVGFPMLDRRLVEFALSLPSALFVREGWSRRVFRDAMAGILPEALRWKPTKADMVVEDPVHMAAQRPLLAGRLAALRGCAPVAGLFDLDAVAARLAALPPAAALARAIDTGRGEDQGIAVAGSLMRAFRIMAYLEQHG
jgi:asparagine synthase (glutamine-hydrolysing)